MAKILYRNGRLLSIDRHNYRLRFKAVKNLKRPVKTGRCFQIKTGIELDTVVLMHGQLRFQLFGRFNRHRHHDQKRSTADRQ